MKKFEKNLKLIKIGIIEAIYRSKKGHLGGSLSSADIIYYFGKSVNIYEGPISVRQGIEPLVFPGNIVFVNQDGTVPDLFGGRKGGLIPISNYVPEGTTIDDMKKTIGEGFEKNSFGQNGLLAIKHLKNPNIEYLEGGSRKKRPKTKRRSKRY